MPTKIPKTILLIIFLATFLRLFRLWSYPSLNPDEAALGYNAFSLIQTGRDEHGVSWPLHLKSFGDYKPAGYTYLAIPFVRLLGLTPLAVRLPNALLSILAVYVTYKLVLLLTSNIQLSSLTAFFLAINPWHLHFSRGAWESSTALTLILLGIYFFFRKKHYFSLFFFVLSTYFYHSARIIAPLLLLSLCFIHKSCFINHISKTIFLIFFGLLITLPVLISFTRNGGAARFGGVGLTADYGPISRAEELLNHHMNVKLVNRILHNRRTLYLVSWAQKYFSHFDLNYLFVNGDEVPRSKIPEMGQFYLLELPFLLLGLYCLIHTSYFIHHKSFLIAFFLISPLASSLTFQAPSALRSLPLVIPTTILISLGLYAFLQKFSSFTVYGLLFIVYFFSLAYYLDAYYAHYQQRYPFAWNQGFDQLVPIVESQKHDFTNIYITDKYDQPYILYLFFSHYPPEKLHPQIKLSPPDNFGFSTVRQIDNIRFEKINWDSIPSNSLVVTADEPVPIDPTKTIDFPNHQPGFKIYVK